MISLLRPTEGQVLACLIGVQDAPLTYPEVGATEGQIPGHYNLDRHRVLLGEGVAVYERAKLAVRDWKVFPPSMVEFVGGTKPMRAGEVVAVLFRAACFWSLNPCRIVYTIDESGDEQKVWRFGFAYGTLPGHVESGEERFLVEWDREHDQVSYEVMAFSRPRHMLARLAYPYARMMQAKFRSLSGKSMQQAVAHSNTPSTSGSVSPSAC